MRIKDLAYIAGFFDGEGCISGHIQTKTRYPTVKISITQKRSKVLYWIKKVLEMGEVYKKSSKGSNFWKIGNQRDIKKFINLMLPYCKVKKKELIVGQRLSNLIGLNGCNPLFENNYRERMVLHNQLKLLKKEKGGF